MSGVKERQTALCKQVHFTKGTQENGPQHLQKDTCARSPLYGRRGVNCADSWLQSVTAGWNVCLFSPTTISVRSMTPLLRNFSINFQRKAEKTGGLERASVSALRPCASKAGEPRAAPQLLCILCSEWLCLALTVTNESILTQTSEPFVLKVLFTLSLTKDFWLVFVGSHLVLTPYS